MARPGDLVAAALFSERAPADEAWGILQEAGVPASVITEPGIMGAYQVYVMVRREDLDEAQLLLVNLVSRETGDRRRET